MFKAVFIYDITVEDILFRSHEKDPNPVEEIKEVKSVFPSDKAEKIISKLFVGPISEIFAKPFSPSEFPGSRKLKPSMSLNIIKKKLSKGQYESSQQFKTDLEVLVENAKIVFRKKPKKLMQVSELQTKLEAQLQTILKTSSSAKKRQSHH